MIKIMTEIILISLDSVYDVLVSLPLIRLTDLCVCVFPSKNSGTTDFGTNDLPQENDGQP